MKVPEEFVYPYILLDGDHREVVEIRKGEPSVHLGMDAYIQHPDPLTSDGKITEDCRRSLLHAACAFAQSRGRDLTIVWGVHGFSYAGVDANGNFQVQSVRLEVDKQDETQS